MINRRRFIQASALLIAGTSTLALTGCGSSKTPEDVACAFVRALYRGDAAEATKFFHVPADARDAEVKIAEAKIIVATPVRKGSCRTRLFAVEAGTVSVKPCCLRAGEMVTVERFFN